MYLFLLARARVQRAMEARVGEREKESHNIIGREAPPTDFPSADR